MRHELAAGLRDRDRIDTGQRAQRHRRSAVIVVARRRKNACRIRRGSPKRYCRETKPRRPRVCRSHRAVAPTIARAKAERERIEVEIHAAGERSDA